MSHPFASHRAVMIAIKRPLSRVLGTDAAREREMNASDKGWMTRKEKQRAADPILNA